MTGEWEVYGESSSYWDVGERCEPPESADAGELAFSPVCRVKKHAFGEEHLRRVLSVPVLERRIAELEQRVEWEKNCAQGAEVGTQHLLAEAQERIDTLESELATERQYRISDNDDIARWQERVRVLEAALRPFAKLFDDTWEHDLDDDDDLFDLTIGSIRAAQSALEGK